MAEDEPGWAAPPRPDGTADGPAEDEPGWAAPPAAPFATETGGSTGRRRLTPRGGHRRRKASGVGAIAGIVLVGARLLFDGGDDASNDFSLPDRVEGEPVRAVPLTSDQVCAVLAPSDLRQIYDRRFQPGAPVDTAAPTGEPAGGGSGGVGETGICRWQTRPGEDELNLIVLSVPSIGGDANRTYELLRPSSPIQGFDSTSDIGDEAFFLVDPLTTTAGYTDTMTLRDGGVVLTFTITGPTKPAGGLDLLAEVGQAAAANLPPPG